MPKTHETPERRPSPEILIPFSALRERGVPYCRLYIGRLVKRGQFPAPVRLSANRIAWKSTDIDRWIASRPVHDGKPIEGAGAVVS